jgi:hypothetical protein
MADDSGKQENKHGGVEEWPFTCPPDFQNSLRMSAFLSTADAKDDLAGPPHRVTIERYRLHARLCLKRKSISHKPTAICKKIS